MALLGVCTHAFRERAQPAAATMRGSTAQPGAACTAQPVQHATICIQCHSATLFSPECAAVHTNIMGRVPSRRRRRSTAGCAWRASSATCCYQRRLLPASSAATVFTPPIIRNHAHGAAKTRASQGDVAGRRGAARYSDIATPLEAVSRPDGRSDARTPRRSTYSAFEMTRRAAASHLSHVFTTSRVQRHGRAQTDLQVSRTTATKDVSPRTFKWRHDDIRCT